MIAATDMGMVAALSFLTLLIPLALFQMRRVWAGIVTEDPRCSDCSSNARSRRAGRRAQPTAVLSCCAIVASGWVMLVIHPLPPRHSDWIQVVAVLVGLAGFAGGGVLCVLILIFNRPTRLVPPHMRDEMSWRDEIRQQRGLE